MAPPKKRALPKPLPEGFILSDTEKKKWRLGKIIGQGGFGLIYLGIYCTHTLCFTLSQKYVHTCRLLEYVPLYLCHMHMLFLGDYFDWSVFLLVVKAVWTYWIAKRISTHQLVMYFPYPSNLQRPLQTAINPNIYRSIRAQYDAFSSWSWMNFKNPKGLI